MKPKIQERGQDKNILIIHVKTSKGHRTTVLSPPPKKKERRENASTAMNRSLGISTLRLVNLYNANSTSHANDMIIVTIHSDINHVWLQSPFQLNNFLQLLLHSTTAKPGGKKIPFAT